VDDGTVSGGGEETGQTAPPRRSRLVGPAFPHLVVAVLAAVIAVAALSLTSTVQGDVGPGTVSIGAAAQREGSTGVALPPFGRVSAATHAAPVGLQVRVDSVDVDRIQQVLAGPRPQAAIEREVRDEMGPLLRKFVIRTLLFAAGIGAVTGLVVARRHWSYGLTGAAGGLVGVSVLLGTMWLTYDVTAFEEARFTGALERAPAIMQTVQQHVGGLDRIEGRVRVVSDQVAGLYAATELEPGTRETLILHVSDIHSNPLGLELAQKLAESFAVDAVLDTGDITSFGLPVESRLVDLLAGFDIPYYLVPGNHDSDANRLALAAAPEVTLLDGEAATVGRVRILGIGDPTYTADNLITTEEANAIKFETAEEVAGQVRSVGVDLLAVHDLRQAADLEGGEVDTVVAGHTHERSEENRNGTLLLTVGSTGATGLGTFMVESEQGYEAQVLRYRGRRLVAIDYVTLSGVSGSFEVDRRVVTDEDRETVEPDGDDDEDDEVSPGGRAAPGRSGPTTAGN
jgi:predicted phosphodiesterase